MNAGRPQNRRPGEYDAHVSLEGWQVKFSAAVAPEGLRDAGTGLPRRGSPAVSRHMAAVAAPREHVRQTFLDEPENGLLNLVQVAYEGVERLR